MDKYKHKWVRFEDVIVQEAHEHGIPAISFDNLVELGKKAVTVFHLQEQGTKISFDMMCHYIKLYISTPFGLKELRKLQY